MSAACLMIAVGWAIGVLLCVRFWPQSRSLGTDAWLILPLGLAFGSGLTSAIFFFSTFAGPAALFSVSVAAEALVFIILAIPAARRFRSEPARRGNFASGSWRCDLLAAVLLAAVAVAAVISARTVAAEPHGGWDGWAIWNLHARVLARGGSEWRALLAAPQLAWTHADYPLLVPASIARLWAHAGETPAASALVSASLAASVLGMVVGAARLLAGAALAWLAGLVLVGTPFFVTFAANQHADIPLAGYIVASLALLALAHRTADGQGWIVLAGVAAGLAAWTKNEGLLFAVVTAAAWTFFSFRGGQRRHILPFFSGLGCALLPVIVFKVFIAPPNDLVTASMGDRLAGLGDYSRHVRIMAAFIHEIPRFGEWQIVPFIFLVLALLGSGRRALIARDGMIAVTLGLMLAGFYTIYLITPWNLAWHLDTSLVRLLLQLWPAIILFWVLAVPDPTGATEEPHGAVRAESTRGRTRFRVLAPVAVLAMMVSLWLLSRQRAFGEIAGVRLSQGKVSVTAGDGWYAPESDRRHAWLWSRGDAKMLVHAETASRVPTTLEFSVRSLGSRKVRARIGERTVWESAVGGTLVPARIEALSLPSGVTMIEFSTDGPAINESAATDARALTFALYDVRIR